MIDLVTEAIKWLRISPDTDPTTGEDLLRIEKGIQDIDDNSIDAKKVIKVIDPDTGEVRQFAVSKIKKVVISSNDNDSESNIESNNNNSDNDDSVDVDAILKALQDYEDEVELDDTAELVDKVLNKKDTEDEEEDEDEDEDWDEDWDEDDNKSK